MLRFPNGYILEAEDPTRSFLVYGELNATGAAAKGWRLAVPNLSHATAAQKNELCRNLQAYLSRFDASRRIQFRFDKDSDYRDILDRYAEDTRNAADNPFVKRFRKEHLDTFRKEIDEHRIWREYLTVYIARPPKEFIAGALDVSSVKEMQDFMNRVGRAFPTEELLLRGAFPFEVRPLTMLELFKSFSNTVNCSQIGQRIDYGKRFTPNLMEVYESDFGEQDLSPFSRRGSTTSSRGYCMFGDGLYHNILTLKSLPPFELFPFYGNALLENNIVNLSVTVNMRATNPARTIEKLEAGTGIYTVYGGWVASGSITLGAGGITDAYIVVYDVNESTPAAMTTSSADGSVNVVDSATQSDNGVSESVLMQTICNLQQSLSAEDGAIREEITSRSRLCRPHIRQRAPVCTPF